MTLFTVAPGEGQGRIESQRKLAGRPRPPPGRRPIAMSRPYAEVIGDPIAHSKSPLIHNFWLRKLGIDAEYLACHVRSDDLTDYFTRRREDAKWRGCNVTIPHKRSVLMFADDILDDSRKIGAANCILPRESRLAARNTDGFGTDAAIRRAVDAACIIGCGGAARAAIANLEALATMEVRVIARDVAKASRLLDEFGYPPSIASFETPNEALKRSDFVINASPLGMTGQPPMPQTILNALSLTTRDAVVFDMIYAPLQTALLEEATRLHRQTVDGLVMLVGQAAGAFYLFFGAQPPREHDAELRALLTA